MEQDTRDTIRLLIVDPSNEEAEALLNVFRDAGHATRGGHITSHESLEQVMSNRQKWDLLLISELTEDLTLTGIQDYIAQQGRDIPAIMLTDYADVSETLEYIKLGVRAVVARNSDEHLLICAGKEVEDLKIRRHYRRMSVALNESEKQRRMLLDDQIDAIVYVGEGIVRYANPAFLELLELQGSDAIVGKHFKELVASNDRQEVDDFLTSIEDSGQGVAAIQCPLLLNGKTEQPIRAVVTPTSFQGEYTLSLLVRAEHQNQSVEDVEQEVLQEAAADSTTGMFDKKQFGEQLDVAIQRVVTGKGKMTLLCISLDTLKPVHEKGGRKMSQPMLASVAKRLGSTLGTEHPAASWGGGYFMSLLNVDGEKPVKTLIDELIDELTENVTKDMVSVDSHQLPVRLSFGAIMLSDTNNDPKTLLVRARHACSQSQKQGGGKLSFYQKRKINVVSSVEKHMAGMVSQAMKHDQIKLFYQPVISLKGSKEEYYEVFLRMTDVRGREHDADNFRSKLDKNSLWGKIDRWQVIQASKDLMAKRKDGHDTRLLLHLGGSSISDSSFLPWMGVALKAAGIPSEAVTIELSEPNLVRYRQEIPVFFNALKEMGCRIAISEFGCSLNPMATIEPLPVDFIKVDPSFTKDITSDNKGDELQEMIKTLAENGRKVIVPQVENSAEMAPLWHSGVDFIQGQFLQEPTETMTFDFGSEF